MARAALELLEADERFGERVARVRAALGGVEQAPETDAEGVEEAVEYAKNELNLARGAARAPAEIEAAAGRGIRVDDAAELHSLEAWEKATPERRKDIATRVAAAFPGGELELHTIEGTVATLRYTPWGILFVLVIGGELSMGLSPSEEAVIRAEAEVRAGTENWEEEFGAFLQSVDDMRPVRTVTLAPFLLAREAGGAGVALGRVPDMLESAPFRLPSEAEWEWAARGGVKGELTPFGNTVPEEPSSFVNRFGLADMGLKPELCSDERAFGYQGAPVDGTPRRGPGPRVARGGAAMLWPWQACGEWQLLMNATRGSTHGWEVGLSLRPVVGISPT